MPSSSLSSGSSWTTQEESKLKKLVEEWKSNNKEYFSSKENKKLEKQSCPAWNHVAKSMKGRSASACLGRWMVKVGNDVIRGNWTDAEDKALVAMMKSKVHDSWSKRAIELGRRFHKGVRRGGAETCSRYMQLQKNSNSNSNKKKAKKEGKGEKKVSVGKKTK